MVWRRFKKGDMEAFALLYSQYVDILFRYGCKLSADDDLVKDAIQEVFVGLYNSRDRNTCDPGHLKFYLFLALKRNLIRNMVRNRRLSNHLPSIDLNFESSYNPEIKLIEKDREDEVRKKIETILEQLPSRQREVIYLRFNEALDYREISDIMGITVDSVRKQVYRAITQMREVIDYKKNMILFHILKKII
jgi:RNA polymerase sigma factor (sigma-70 family)